MNRMPLRPCLLLFCLFLMSAPLAAAQSKFSFPCDPELSPFFSKSEHEITREIDLAEYSRMEYDNRETEMMPLESGSLVILDDAFMIISLRFSEEYDYEAHDTHLPDGITLINDDHWSPKWPVWRVMMSWDQGDPYSFYYIGSWDPSISILQFCGTYTDPQGEQRPCFHLQVDI